MNETHTTTQGHYEKEFLLHNKKIESTLRREDLTALPIHMAIKMVQEGTWEPRKHRFLVILPNKKWKKKE